MTARRRAATEILTARNRRRPRVLLALGWYSTALHHGAVRYGREAGWVMDLYLMRAARVPHTWRGDGIVSTLGTNPQVTDLVLASSLPKVNIGYGMPGSGLPHVVHDNVEIGRLAAEHFRSRGFVHYAGVVHSQFSGGRERIAAFEHAVAGVAKSFHTLDWSAAHRVEDRPTRRSSTRRAPGAGKEDDEDVVGWLAVQLSRLPKPLAVMAEFDDIALEVIDACMLRGLAVPEQVAVLGVDNDELRCELAAVPLSSVDNDQERLGYEAAALLDRLMGGATPPTEPIRVSPKGVVARLSTDILAIPHVDVARALRTIIEHYTEPITAQEVAKTVPMSARCLHDAFVKHVGRTMAQEIARRRLDLACRLLEETNQKTYEIADRCGFSGAARLTKVFRRLLNTTPASYRRVRRKSQVQAG